MPLERAQALEGRVIVALRSVDGGEDWTEMLRVGKVLKVDPPTPSSPRGAIRFISPGEPGTKGIRAGFHAIGVDEICEVIPPVKRPPQRVSA